MTAALPARPRRTLVGAAIALATAIGLSACAAPTESGDAETVFTITSQTGIDLDPTTINGITALSQVLAIYEPLVDQKTGTTELEPALATSWETDDNITWTFQLAEGVEFTDGTAFDSAAVKANFERAAALGGVAGDATSQIAAIDTPDDSTVVFTLTEPKLSFVWDVNRVLIASPTAFTENEVDGDRGYGYLSRNPVGTGPYALRAYDEGTIVTLEANENYREGWREGQVDVINFIQAPDPATEIQMLLTGEVDALGALLQQSEYLEQLSASDLSVNEVVSLSQDEIHINTQSPALADVRVREAIASAFDFAAAARAAYGELGSVAEGPLPVGLPGATEVQDTRLDRDHALDLLAEAGVDPGSLTLRLTYTEGLEMQRAEALVLQDSLKQIGVDLEVTALPWAEFAQQQSDPATAADFAFLSGGPAVADPVAKLRSYYSATSSSYNWSFLDSPEFDALLDEADAAPDDATRDALLAQAQQILADEVVALWVAQPTTVQAVNSAVQGFHIHLLNYGNSYRFYEYTID